MTKETFLWHELVDFLECFRAPSRHNLRQNVRELGLWSYLSRWWWSERSTFDGPTSGDTKRKLQLLSSMFLMLPLKQQQLSSIWWNKHVIFYCNLRNNKTILMIEYSAWHFQRRKDFPIACHLSLKWKVLREWHSHENW